MKDYCELCEKEVETGYELNDEYVCSDCYQSAIARAEYYYESAREDNLV